MRCCGGRDAGLLQQLDARAGAPRRRSTRQVRLDRLDQLAADRVQRIERGQRVLEDRADRAAADLAHLLVAAGCRCAGRRAGSRPPAMRPGGSSRPMMAAPVSDLPAPDSPTTPSTSPGAMSNETSSSARSVPRRVGNSTRRLLDFAAGDHGSRLISAASGSARRAASRPAGSPPAPCRPASRRERCVIHQSPENRKSLPMRISVPSDGWVGGTPTPRNDSVASVMMASREIDRRDHQHRAEHVGQHVAQHDRAAATCR